MFLHLNVSGRPRSQSAGAHHPRGESLCSLLALLCRVSLLTDSHPCCSTVLTIGGHRACVAQQRSCHTANRRLNQSARPQALACSGDCAEPPSKFVDVCPRTGTSALPSNVQQTTPLRPSFRCAVDQLAGHSLRGAAPPTAHQSRTILPSFRACGHRVESACHSGQRPRPPTEARLPARRGASHERC